MNWRRLDTGRIRILSRTVSNVQDSEALEAACQAELEAFYVALRGAEGALDTALEHLAALRGLSAAAAEASTDAQLWRELHGACVAQAGAAVEQRVQELIASFHERLHEDRFDLLAVDVALQEGGRLMRAATPEVGEAPLRVSAEVLAACEARLHGLLQGHLRRANRHELRMLYARRVKVAVLTRPYRTTKGSSGGIRRLQAALRTREERPFTSDPTERPCPWSHAPPN